MDYHVQPSVGSRDINSDPYASAKLISSHLCRKYFTNSAIFPAPLLFPASVFNEFHWEFMANFDKGGNEYVNRIDKSFNDK